MNHRERLGAKADEAFAEMITNGLSIKQANEILNQATLVQPYELELMAFLGKGLEEIRGLTESAEMYGLVKVTKGKK